MSKAQGYRPRSATCSTNFIPQLYVPTLRRITSCYKGSGSYGHPVYLLPHFVFLSLPKTPDLFQPHVHPLTTYTLYLSTWSCLWLYYPEGQIQNMAVVSSPTDASEGEEYPLPCWAYPMLYPCYLFPEQRRFFKHSGVDLRLGFTEDGLCSAPECRLPGLVSPANRIPGPPPPRMRAALDAIRLPFWGGGIKLGSGLDG